MKQKREDDDEKKNRGGKTYVIFIDFDQKNIYVSFFGILLLKYNFH